MNADDLDDVICEIMIKDGPDGHTDGHEVITDFILAVIKGNGEKWKNEYKSKP